jgi:hypothetical protein
MTTETTVRARAKRAGFFISKSRRRSVTPTDYGEYMLTDARGIPYLGWYYDATLDEIDEYLALD